ncbi:hypothetical protein F5883DRAFT_656552 [Diaporthe sp. PMI_573]|nr:hypothetical protein F5883DRAFT_656552 [Diaporthaceae sp. PMI_573]
MDQDGGSQGCRPCYRGPVPLKNRPVSPAEPPTNGPGPATRVENLFPLYCRVILNAATGGRALEKATSTEISAFLDACLQEHVQNRPSGQGNSKSTGGAPVATSTPAASTPSGSGKEPAKKRRRESDGDEDENVRKGKRRGGKEREANAKFGCPFYMFDKHEHSSCRSAVLRNFSDLLHHFKRAHKSLAHFCDTCWEVFDSHAELSAHEQSSTQCRGRTFPHLWAREQDLVAVRRTRRNELKATWFAIYDAIFTGTQQRRPTFCIASAQDFMDRLSDIEQSEDFQAQIFGNALLKYCWQMCHGFVVQNLRREEQLSLYPGQPFDRNHRAGLHLGLGSSTQHTMLLGTAQDIFEPITHFQPNGLNGLGTYPPMPPFGSPVAANSLMDPVLSNGLDISQYFGLGSSAAQTTHPQFSENAPGPTHMYLPMQQVTGHAISLGVTPQTALQMFSHNPPNPRSTSATQATAEPLGQEYGMPPLPQTYPQQQAQPSQMNFNTPGSQSAPPGMLTGLNQAQSNQSMDSDGAPAPTSNFEFRRR